LPASPTGKSQPQPADVEERDRGASVPENRRDAFDTEGHDDRLIVAVADKSRIVGMKRVGTHEECVAVATKPLKWPDSPRGKQGSAGKKKPIRNALVGNTKPNQRIRI